MGIYFSDIVQACIAFPLVALALTVPFMVYQYRKRGSVPWFNTLVAYSFVFYLLCVYSLVLLPLPADHSAYVPGAAHPQLVPFGSLSGIRAIFAQDLTVLETLKALLKNPSVIHYLFNILMLVPLGMYLRYFFKCGVLKTVALSFLCSLSCEMLQYTGILGWYEHPYRVTDVDDLIANTLGGLVGFVLMGPAIRALPELNEIDRRAREAGVRVSATRRALSFAFDAVLVLGLVPAIDWCARQVPFAARKIAAHPDLWDTVTSMVFEPAVFLVAFALIPALTHGQTLGQKIVKIYVARVDGTRAPWYLCFLRYLLLFVFIEAPSFLVEGAKATVRDMEGSEVVIAFLKSHQAEIMLLAAIAVGLWVLTLLVRAFVAWRRQAPFVLFNGLVTGTRVYSLAALQQAEDRFDAYFSLQPSSERLGTSPGQPRGKRRI